MPSVPGPIIPRRRLATALRNLRENAGLSIKDVAEELMINASKVSRLENAQGSPQARDVRDMVRLYGVDGTPPADELMRLVRRARQKAWWHDYKYDNSGFAAGIDEHIEYESEAAVAKIYTIPYVPALLQTEAYTRALYRSMEPWRSADDVDQLVRLRSRRREVLGRTEPLRLEAVMHECAMRQFVGSRRIVRDQLAALLAQPENVLLRILPFSGAPVFASTCMWALFVFGDSLNRDVVHVETHAGFRYIEDGEQVSAYHKHFGQLWQRALDEAESRSFIEDAMRGWLPDR